MGLINWTKGDPDALYPFYTTRKSAGEGETMTWKVDGRNAFRIILLTVFAIQLWLIIALVAGIGVILAALVKLILLLVSLL